MTIVTCPQCLANLPPSAKRCPRCGHAAPVPDVVATTTDVVYEAIVEDAETSPSPGRAIAVGAALVLVALLLAIAYASC